MKEEEIHKAGAEFIQLGTIRVHKCKWKSRQTSQDVTSKERRKENRREQGLTVMKRTLMDLPHSFHIMVLHYDQ